MPADMPRPVLFAFLFALGPGVHSTIYIPITDPPPRE